MIAFYGAPLSAHMAKTPEGYLICYGVPINRTGMQEYLARELGLEGDPERVVPVWRTEDEVFSASALASFEGKDVTRLHPPELLRAETQAAYSKGHAENVRREGEQTVADLVIKDPALIAEIENGQLREISCGYECQYEPHRDGYRQTHIIGNHIAVVPRGRAGHMVAIQDAERQKGPTMEHETPTPAVVQETPAADAAAVQETPAPAAPAESPAADPTGEKLDRILSLLERALGGEKKEGCEALEDAIRQREQGCGRGAGLVSSSAPADACKTGDAALDFLRTMQPIVNAIPDRKARDQAARTVLDMVKGQDPLPGILSAAQDASADAARRTQETRYEQICRESAEAYAAFDPNRKKEV